MSHFLKFPGQRFNSNRFATPGGHPGLQGVRIVRLQIYDGDFEKDTREDTDAKAEGQKQQPQRIRIAPKKPLKNKSKTVPGEPRGGRK